MINQQLQIMHLLPSLDPGGMENGVVNLVNGHKEPFLGHICCLENTGSFQKRIANPAVQVHIMNKKPGFKLGLVFQLAQLLRQAKIDIVHTHNHLTLVYGIPAAKIAKVPIIIHGEHGSPFHYNLKRRLIYQWCYRQMDALFVVAQSLGCEIVETKGVGWGKIKIVPNGVDTNIFQGSQKDDILLKKLDIKKGDFVIGSIGRVEPIKNYEIMPLVAAEIKKKFPNVKWLVVGDGSGLSRLKKEILEKNLVNDFILPGKTDNVPAMLSLMDIFVLPSLNEGMANSILEAMSCGKPIIATDVGANSELICDGENGYIIPKNEERPLIDKILYLLENPEICKSFGEKSRQKVESKWSMGAMIDSYQKIYSEIWQEKKQDS
ncbi:MAG: glycosyltransferase [Pseudomonadota bacterium]